ncbi:nucleoside phosphorylase domain-containing protein [Chaetomium fimeti]|uniref:Nucleoside phosphorylase domain-containing protein n=1 Tax=Chaetomium fimeti TaxID=1854472 RepID=A0AAE0LUD3_9PEZI|nr:nucleoside phosphorylase domain-containing protein [Chaetomium fimeti]
MSELDPTLYTVAWIAPLEIEAQAALHMFDNIHPGGFRTSQGDDYLFYAGDVCGHNVVLATLPAGQEYGTGSAAALASQVKKCFPHLWFGLLVGVAAGLPHLSCSPPRDIRLGDILVALPEGGSPAVVAYDLGKEAGAGGLQLLRAGHVLATTDTIVRAAIGKIKADHPNEARRFLPYYQSMKEKGHTAGNFTDPGQDRDVLYGADEQPIQREWRPDAGRTRVWYGPIGSGDKLMRHAQKRDELRDMYNLIGLEMEAAGTMNHIRVGVIRGVCDYGDERKNKEWQPYAAAMAAAYAKAILREIFAPPSKNPAMAAAPVASGHQPTPQEPARFVFNGPISGRNVQTGLSFSGPTTFNFN